MPLYRLGELDLPAVDRNFHAAQHLQHEPGGGDDDVRRKFAAILQADAVPGEGVDLCGRDGGAVFLDRLEQIAVGHQAQPLVPRVVAWREMGGDVVVGPERHPHTAEDQLLDLRRLAPGQLEEIHAPQHVAPADQMIGEL